MTKTNDDARLSRDEDFDVVGRVDSRRTSDRSVTENRELTDEDRLAMFRKQLYNDALPDLPNIPGYHVCWLTTSNPRDSIHRRMQLGYEPVRGDEVPGMAYATLKTGEYSGMVGINEMVAFKLPDSLYQAFMQEVHHDAPRAEEAKLSQVSDLIRAQAEERGAKVEEFDGAEDLRRTAARVPIFR